MDTNGFFFILNEVTKTKYRRTKLQHTSGTLILKANCPQNVGNMPKIEES